VTCDPRLVTGADWPDLAAELDRTRAAGLDVATRLAQLAVGGPLTDDNPAAPLRSRLAQARDALPYRLADGPYPGPAPQASTVHHTAAYTNRAALPTSRPAR
jgi:hypothetical protein